MPPKSKPNPQAKDSSVAVKGSDKTANRSGNSDRDKSERTQTSSFGTSKRLGHDSSSFYDRKMYDGQGAQNKNPNQEKLVDDSALNQVYCHTSEDMSELPDESVHLFVTSPPYNVGKEYDEDLSLKEYSDLLRGVFAECYRVLVDGGRACVNVANVGRKPYIALNGLVSQIMCEIGYLMRGEIIWDKGASAGVSCAWGSWKSPSNPVLRDVHEYILVFSKGSYKRQRTERKPTIEKDGFLEWTKSVWEFSAESARKVGHPAPFPVELPLRLIELYTYADDIVLDPFMGSGSTAIACLKTKRRWIGYDTSNEYCEITRNRVLDFRANEPMFD